MKLTEAIGKAKANGYPRSRHSSHIDLIRECIQTYGLGVCYDIYYAIAKEHGLIPIRKQSFHNYKSNAKKSGGVKKG